MQDNTVYDPLKNFKNIYKDLHNENTINYFDELVEKANINIDENQTTVKKINNLKNNRTNIDKKLSGQKSLKIFLIVVYTLMIIRYL